jgi:sulfotransferase
MSKEIFFQSSLPRAGSTLLQNILGQNPEFYVTPTSGVLELLFAARGNYSNSAEFKAQDAELMKKGWLGFCKQGMQGFFEGVTDKKYVVDKSRGWGIHLPFLKTFTDKPKVICLVRDPRAIFASMEKNFRKHPEKDSGIVNWGTGQCTTVEKRIQYWASSPPIGLALSRLKEMLDTGLFEDILFVKFEDLTDNPTREMKRVYKYLEVPEYKHDFKNVEQLTQEDDTVYGIFGDHKIQPEVKYIEPDYGEVLGGKICADIVKTYEWLYRVFDYK